MDYFTFGNGKKPFVIIPGMSVKSILLSATAVATAFSEFTKEYKIYCFDRKRNIKEEYSLFDMARDTADALTLSGLYGCHVFGASQGGMLALIIAARYRGLVEKCAVCSTASKPNETLKCTFSEWITKANGGDAAALNRCMFEKIYSREYLSRYADAFKAIERDATAEEMTKIAVLSKSCLDVDFYGELENISCPVFVCGSKNDKVFSAAASVEIIEKLGCEGYIYDGFGHAVYDEAPDFRNRLLRFFQG